MIVYAKEELNVIEQHLNAELTDLPILTFQISFSRERKTVVNFFYREFTNGVTGLNSAPDQIERLGRMIKHWQSLVRSNKDVICLGDANLCAVKWNDDSYYLKDQAEMVQTFLLENDSFQLVKGFTRSEIVKGGEV